MTSWDAQPVTAGGSNFRAQMGGLRHSPTASISATNRAASSLSNATTSETRTSLGPVTGPTCEEVIGTSVQVPV